MLSVLWTCSWPLLVLSLALWWRRRDRRLLVLAAAALVLAVVTWPPLILVQRVISVLAMPVGLLWLLLWLASLWPGLGRRRWLALAPLAVLTLAGNQHLALALVGSLEAPYRERAGLASDPIDVLVVLGGGTALGPEGWPQAGGTGDRVVQAARLYHAGLAPLLIATGRSIAGVHIERDLAAETARIWQGLGIPASAIIRISTPRNTREEIRDVTALVGERGWRRVGLLTSAWHLPRAEALARRAGLDAIPFPADFIAYPVPLSAVSLVPQANALGATTVALWEYLGRAVGR